MGSVRSATATLKGQNCSIFLFREGVLLGIFSTSYRNATGSEVRRIKYRGISHAREESGFKSELRVDPLAFLVRAHGAAPGCSTEDRCAGTASTETSSGSETTARHSCPERNHFARSE